MRGRHGGPSGGVITASFLAVILAFVIIILCTVWINPTFMSINTRQSALQSSITTVNSSASVNRTLLSSGTFDWAIVSAGGVVCNGTSTVTFNFWNYAVANGISSQILELDAPARTLVATDATCEGPSYFVHARAYNFDPFIPQLGSYSVTSGTWSLSTTSTETMLAQTCAGGTTCFIGISNFPPIAYHTSLLQAFDSGGRVGVSLTYQLANGTADIFPFAFSFDTTLSFPLATGL